MRDYLCNLVDIIPPDDSVAWAGAMRAMLNPESRAKTLLRNKRIVSVKTWEKSVEQFKMVVEQLVRN